MRAGGVAEIREGRVAAEDDTGDVDVDELPVPARRGVLERPGRQQPGVVDEDVEPAVGAELLEYAGPRGGVGDVEGTGGDLPRGDRGALLGELASPAVSMSKAPTR